MSTKTVGSLPIGANEERCATSTLVDLGGGSAEARHPERT